MWAGEVMGMIFGALRVGVGVGGVEEKKEPILGL